METCLTWQGERAFHEAQEDQVFVFNPWFQKFFKFVTWNNERVILYD